MTNKHNTLLYAWICAIAVFCMFGQLAALGQLVTINASGDILLDRGVAVEVGRHGYGYPLANVRKTLTSADFAFANLECPLSSTGTPVDKRYSFRANPLMAACLSDGGISVVSCANNHSMDCGSIGLKETMDTLRARHIAWCGAGNTLADALTPTVIKVRGVRIAFVGFCQFVPNGIVLRPNSPTLALASDANVIQAVTAARKQADIVIASFHWGVEFTSQPTDIQEHLAHVAAENGADLVFGHHPHVTQGLEVVRTNGRICLIDYSLGNFVFDQHLRSNKDPESTVILKVSVGKDGLKSASIIPVCIYNCAPYIATGPDARVIGARVAALSSELGTKITQNNVILLGERL
jgi:poly-gamma-glutamate capsule biosynthesis protein CapA/YwtB (metallophosphatase superfamily)